jgi:hypothetical protein
MINLG